MGLAVFVGQLAFLRHHPETGEGMCHNSCISGGHPLTKMSNKSGPQVLHETRFCVDPWSRVNAALPGE